MTPAQSGAVMAWQFVQKVNEVILFPLIMLMTAFAVLVFLYGCFEYIINANNQTARDTGRKHILWGIVGLFVMLTAYSLLTLAANTFGLKGRLDCATNPEECYRPTCPIGHVGPC